MWSAVQSDQESNPTYDWAPLYPDLSAYLDVTTAQTSAKAARTPLSVVLEEQRRLPVEESALPEEPSHLHDGAPRGLKRERTLRDYDMHHEQHCAAASLVHAQERHRFLATDITRLWGLRPPRPGTYPGLGSDGSERPHPSMKGMPPFRRAEVIRHEHARWLEAGDSDSADVKPQLDPEAYYAAWVSTVPKGAPPTRLQAIHPSAVSAVTFAETDLRLTPSIGTSLVNSLYIRDFTVLRRVNQETRKGVRKGEFATYRVTKALACHGRALPDSGAAPSILTTGMLAELPAECVTYYPNERHSPLDAAGGTPLTVTIVRSGGRVTQCGTTADKSAGAGS